MELLGATIFIILQRAVGGRFRGRCEAESPLRVREQMQPARLIGMIERVIYESSNGDVWVLARDPASEMPNRETSAKRRLRWTDILY
jgi:hypothetical protein